MGIIVGSCRWGRALNAGEVRVRRFKAKREPVCGRFPFLHDQGCKGARIMQVHYTEKEQKRKNLGKEVWRWIPGYEGIYKVSDHGRVWMVGRTYEAWNGQVWCKFIRKAKMVKQHEGPKVKYKLVKLQKDKDGRSWMVHRLVLMAFIGPRPDGMEACHFDGDPANNKVENLRWDTSLNNQRDRIRHGRTTKGKHVNAGEDNGQAKLSYEIAEQIRREYIPRRMPMRMFAKKYGVCEAVVHDIIHGILWVRPKR
jgi:hypothetical protein